MGDTFFLFSRPSFLEGVARSLDMGNTLREYNESITEEQADAIAIFNDWGAIGDDFITAMDQIKIDFPEEREPEFEFQEI